MNIEINVDEKLDGIEVKVSCGEMTQEVENLLAVLRMMDNQLTVSKEGEIHLIDVSKIIYIENVDRKCFVYTADDIYESGLRLYEMEEKLCDYGFIRVSKSFLVHLQYIQSLKAEINRKLRVTMTNGEQIIASRQYADELKKRLGL